MSAECEVVFWPGEKRVTVARGTSLLQAARLSGLTIEAPCGGKGTCGKCRVTASGAVSSPDDAEAAKLGGALAAGARLACCARVEGAARVALRSGGSETFVALTDGQSRRWPLDPPAAAGRPGQGWYGVAVDIGTTGVVAELYDLADGTSLGVCSCLNPQSEFGGDVLTRIAFASQHDDGTKLLQQKIVGGVNRLIGELSAASGLAREEISAVVAAGNTTMLHLLLGVSPHSLARAPYRPVFTQQREVAPAAVGLEIAPGGVVTVLPAAAAFVGADIVAGIVALGLQRYRKTALFIDIGTNGEIVLCRDGRLAGASAAAGPALEGMNITCGCRAENGAIAGVSIDGNGGLHLEVIGDASPAGICGSGLIDLVAELARCGVIEPNGRFAKRELLPPPLAARLAAADGRPAFVVSAAGQVILRQADVRQVQLAKGAIAAAIGLLLEETATSWDAIEEILVAGAFGAHLKPASLVGIGLLPAAGREKIRFVGNTAQAGAAAALLSRQAGLEMREIAQRLKVYDLSTHPGFPGRYVQALAFPALPPAAGNRATDGKTPLGYEGVGGSD